MEASSKCPEVSIKVHNDPTVEWLNGIMQNISSSNNNNDGSKNNQSDKRPKIQRVPAKLAQIDSNKKCYLPSVVSIGPYHHGAPELRTVEELKPAMACEFALDSGKEISVLYNKVADMAREARSYYAEGSTEGLDNNAFARMMFLDGCFILHFIYCKVTNLKRENLKMKRDVLAYVQRDLFLLENQLPFEVLDALLRLRFEERAQGDHILDEFIKQTRALPPRDQGCSYAETAKRFMPSLWPKRELIWKGGQAEKPPKDRSPFHLLDHLHSQLIDKRALPTICQLNKSQDGWHSFRSAKELKATGIHFRASKTSCFTDVMFESGFIYGTLRLPPMTVDDSTKSIMLNLVAYETCPDAPDDSAVTSYICFMDSLIDHAEDVKELRAKGILLNFLGSDQHVAELFNEIGNDLVPNPRLYDSVQGNIEKHYKDKWKIWNTECLHTHFRTPWAFLAFLAAIYVIILTTAQTFFAAHPPKNN